MTRIDQHQSSKLTFAESAAPSTPASGLVLVYAKTDGKLYIKDDAGTETDLTVTGAGSFDGAKVYNNGTQSIATVTTTALTFDSEDFDTASYHSTVSNTSRLTVPTTGKYKFRGYVFWEANATGIRLAKFRIDGTTEVAPDVRAINLNTGNPTLMPVTELSLTAGQYVELLVYQDSGGNRNVGLASPRSAQCEFSAIFLGT